MIIVFFNIRTFLNFAIDNTGKLYYSKCNVCVSCIVTFSAYKIYKGGRSYD